MLTCVVWASRDWFALLFCLQHYFHLSSDTADGDIYLYNKPGGQGTGGKGNHILPAQHVSATRPQLLCVWGEGNPTKTVNSTVTSNLSPVNTDSLTLSRWAALLCSGKSSFLLLRLFATACLSDSDAGVYM